MIVPLMPALLGSIVVVLALAPPASDYADASASLRRVALTWTMKS